MEDNTIDTRPTLTFGRPALEPTAAEVNARKIETAAKRACRAGNCVTAECDHAEYREAVQQLIDDSLVADAEDDFKGYTEITAVRCKKNGLIRRNPGNSALSSFLFLGVCLVVLHQASTERDSWGYLLTTGLLSAIVAACIMTLSRVSDWFIGGNHYRSSEEKCFVPESSGLFTHTRGGKLVSRVSVVSGHYHTEWHFCKIDQIPADKRLQVLRDLQR